MTWIASSGYFKGEIPQELHSNPEFRRATRNQMMAYLAIKECLEKIPAGALNHKERVGIVLGTSHGELDSTVSFLSELGLSGTARPFFFQSSLHHSILGFLTKVFSLTGPSLTVCNCHRSGEDAIQAALLLLESTVDLCLVVGVDALVPKIQGPLQSMYPAGTKLGEGAGVLLFANQVGKELAGCALAEFVEQSYLKEMSSEKVSSTYDSCAIEWVARSLAEKSEIVIEKPDHTGSKISWKLL